MIHPDSSDRRLGRDPPGVHWANGGSYSGCAVRTAARLAAVGRGVRRRLRAPLAVGAAVTAASLCCFGCGSSVTGSAASTAGSATAGTARSRPVPRASGFGSNWTTYHGTAEATGVARGAHQAAAFAAGLDLADPRRAAVRRAARRRRPRRRGDRERHRLRDGRHTAGASCGHATWRRPCHPVTCPAATSRPRSALRAPR